MPSAGSPRPGRSATSRDPGHALGAGDIAAGPDGALWFTNLDASIGRVDATTHAVTNYTDGAVNQAKGITPGPDGALWFTDVGNNSIGRIDATSHAITEYTDTSVSDPTGIATGPGRRVVVHQSRHQHYRTDRSHDPRHHQVRRLDHRTETASSRGRTVRCGSRATRTAIRSAG